MLMTATLELACGVSARGARPFILALTLCAGLVAVAPTAAASEPARKLALLVGIDDYGSGAPALGGCVADVTRARSLLIDRMGFAADDVLLLTNEAATHAALVRAFEEWLLARATEQTEVVFWFSGHGSSVPSDGDEREQRDSTFLTADSRLSDRSGQLDFTDDELSSLLRALTQRTSQVVVITDSCHSGGGVRGGPVSSVRSVPAGTQPLDLEQVAEFWPQSVALEAGELDTSAYVHIAACGPQQLAFEHSYKDLEGSVRRQGALSFFLLDALERCAPGTTWRQLADETALKVSTRYPAQSVWCEGDLDRAVFGGGFAAAPEGFVARHFGARVVVQAGRLHGLQRGSRLIMRSNLATADSAALGQVDLTQVEATSASGRWLAAPDELALGAILRASVEGRPNASHPLRVFMPQGVTLELDPDYAVQAQTRETAQLEVRAAAQGRLQLFDVSGHLIWDDTDAEAGRLSVGLNGVLRKELVRQSLYELPNDPGSMRVFACFEEPTPAEAARFGLPATTLTSYDNSARLEQLAIGGQSPTSPTLAMLVLRNDESVPVYCTVFSLPESRQYGTNQHAVEPIWPPRGLARDNRLAPGEVVRVPTGLVASEGWLLERPLRDRYLVIVLPRWADFSGYLTSTRSSQSGAELPAVIQSALAGRATRGAAPVTLQAKPWGITTVDLFVTSEGK